MFSPPTLTLPRQRKANLSQIGQHHCRIRRLTQTIGPGSVWVAGMRTLAERHQKGYQKNDRHQCQVTNEWIAVLWFLAAF